jgi:hypothetical protein
MVAALSLLLLFFTAVLIAVARRLIPNLGNTIKG